MVMGVTAAVQNRKIEASDTQVTAVLPVRRRVTAYIKKTRQDGQNIKWIYKVDAAQATNTAASSQAPVSSQRTRKRIPAAKISMPSAYGRALAA